MAENYTLRSFGLNIVPKTANKEVVQKEVGKAIEGLWEPVFDYLEQNESVFNGDIHKEIEKVNIQMLNLGMEMRRGDNQSDFDVKI